MIAAATIEGHGWRWPGWTCRAILGVRVCVCVGGWSGVGRSGGGDLMAGWCSAAVPVARDVRPIGPDQLLPSI